MYDSQGKRKKCPKLSAKQYNVRINFAIVAFLNGQEYFYFYRSVRAIALFAEAMCVEWCIKSRSSSLNF